jgi:hypothetical protein
VSVHFATRMKAKTKHALVVEMSPAAANDTQKLRLRVDIAPAANKKDPALISVGIAAYRLAASAPEEDELLTKTPVSTSFDFTIDDLNPVEVAEEPAMLELSSIQSLGPMLAELQHTWFQERARDVKPRNVEFAGSFDLSNYWVSATSDESWRTWQPELTGVVDDGTSEEAGRFLAALVVWRCLAALYAGDDSRRPMRQLAGLPEPEEFFPKRPVDVNPSEVREHLTQRKLRVPWHVIEAACTSLNAGKHVIFTGPPGCGKTELAVELALFATRRERDGLLVTASPAWSSSELIGRYIPKQATYGLDFSPGFFLRAIRDRRWLIIDEFNRAPIDACFGELFTVLAGQLVELPFEEQQPSGASARVRVVPAVRDSSARGPEGEARIYADYVVPSEFRIIGTMNDADRSELSRMSFALLRRFDIIRVDAPDPEELALVIDDAMASAKQQTELLERGYIFKGARGGAANTFESLKDVLREVFIGESGKVAERARPTGLVSDRVVGVATCRDVIAFVAEGLRASVPAGPVEERSRRCRFKKQDESERKYHPHNLARSYLAMALVLKVFPQLEALDATQRFAVIKRMTEIFRGSTFLRIEPVKDDNPEDCSFEIASVDAGVPADSDGDGTLSIPEYLVDEICCQLRGTGEEERYQELLGQLAQNDEQAGEST